VGNKLVAVLLHSPHGLDFNFFRAMTHVLLYALLLYLHLLDFSTSFLLASLCAQLCRGCVEDPRTALLYYLCVAFHLITLIN